MFKTNESPMDRLLRVILGAGLLVWFFVEQGSGIWHWAKLIGIVPLVTGVTGNCLLYSLLGISTNRVQS